MDLNLNGRLLQDLDQRLSTCRWPNGTVIDFINDHHGSMDSLLVGAVRMADWNAELACVLAVAASATLPSAERLAAYLFTVHDIACDREAYVGLGRSGGRQGVQDFRLRQYHNSLGEGDLDEADRQWQRYLALEPVVMAPVPDLGVARDLTARGLAIDPRGNVHRLTWEDFIGGQGDWTTPKSARIYSDEGYLAQHPSKEEFVAAVVRTHGGAEGVAVVDFGCADGALTSRIAASLPGAAVVGIDISADNIAEAAAKHPGVAFARCCTPDEVAAAVEADGIVLCASSVFLTFAPSQVDAYLDALAPRLRAFVFLDDVMNTHGDAAVMRTTAYVAHPFAALARARGLERIEVLPVGNPKRCYNGIVIARA